MAWLDDDWYGRQLLAGLVHEPWERDWYEWLARHAEAVGNTHLATETRTQMGNWLHRASQARASGRRVATWQLRQLRGEIDSCLLGELPF